jgi:hypothetical protein
MKVFRLPGGTPVAAIEQIVEADGTVFETNPSMVPELEMLSVEDCRATSVVMVQPAELMDSYGLAASSQDPVRRRELEEGRTTANLSGDK